MDQYVKAPNKVVEAQRMFAAGEGPIFQRGKFDRMILRGVFLAISAGGLMIAIGAYRMATGTGKIQKF
jgi:hypothetical protein